MKTAVGCCFIFALAFPAQAVNLTLVHEAEARLNASKDRAIADYDAIRKYGQDLETAHSTDALVKAIVTGIEVKATAPFESNETALKAQVQEAESALQQATNKSDPHYKVLVANVRESRGALRRIIREEIKAVKTSFRHARSAAKEKAKVLGKAAESSARARLKDARRVMDAQRKARLPEYIYEGDFLKSELASEAQENHAESARERAEAVVEKLYEKVEDMIDSWVEQKKQGRSTAEQTFLSVEGSTASLALPVIGAVGVFGGLALGLSRQLFQTRSSELSKPILVQ